MANCHTFLDFCMHSHRGRMGTRQDSAHDFKEIEEKIENFTIEYFSVISKDIISKLDIAKNCAAEGKFEDPQTQKAINLLIHYGTELMKLQKS